MIQKQESSELPMPNPTLTLVLEHLDQACAMPPPFSGSASPVGTGRGESKQPWQMTRAEMVANDMRRQILNQRGESYIPADDPNPKEQDYWARRFSSVHRSIVEQAVGEGRPVPENVLADYPDLRRRIVERGLEATGVYVMEEKR